MLQGDPGTGARARALRSAMTPPEIALWQVLRTRPEGLKFRRQHPAGPYVADFYCHAARLVVEVDGEAHGRGVRPAADDRRDQWFDARGLQTLRLPAGVVRRDLDASVRGIVAVAKSRLADQE